MPNEWRPLPARGPLCVRCVMDQSAELSLDARGVCHYCRAYDELAQKKAFDPETLTAKAQALVAAIRARGKGRRYDCVIGLSGGADSSYALLLAKRQGLRPLAVHVDNGWNTELAVVNI